MGGEKEFLRLATQSLRKFSHKYRGKIPMEIFNGGRIDGTKET
jgi:hypothetical protein